MLAKDALRVGNNKMQPLIDLGGVRDVIKTGRHVKTHQSARYSPVRCPNMELVAVLCEKLLNNNMLVIRPERCVDADRRFERSIETRVALRPAQRCV